MDMCVICSILGLIVGYWLGITDLQRILCDDILDEYGEDDEELY